MDTITYNWRYCLELNRENERLIFSKHSDDFENMRWPLHDYACYRTKMSQICRHSFRWQLFIELISPADERKRTKW